MVDFSLMAIPPAECRTIIDVGANAGQFLHAALAYFTHADRVIAIEMLPDMAERLRSIPRVTVVQHAVGAAASVAPVLRSVHSEASSLLMLNPQASQWYGRDLLQFAAGTVPVRALDEIWREHGGETVDVLKIDVQGYEDAVIAGAQETLAKTRRLMIEVEYVPVYEGQKLAPAIYALVEAAGFEYVCNLTEYHSAAGELLHADALFRRPGV